MHDFPFDPWNRDDERALINLVPRVVEESFIQASKVRPELFNMDEQSLATRLRKEKRNPTPTDNRLRIAFWQAYDRAQAEGKMRLEIGSIFVGVCTKAYFYNEYLSRPEKVAWLVCPPASYTVMMEEALTFGLGQLRDILNTPHTLEDDKGELKIDLKLATLKAKIVAMLDVRINGAPTQKIEQRNMNLNIETTDKRVQDIMTSNSMEEIEARLIELRRLDKKQLKEIEVQE